MDWMVDVKVPWLSLEQFCSLKGLPLSKAQSALKLPA